tara:strand:- start:4171 stop:4644 length:474 start_codon:yes stop_codon:yes gene_type:complete
MTQDNNPISLEELTADEKVSLAMHELMHAVISRMHKDAAALFAENPRGERLRERAALAEEEKKLAYVGSRGHALDLEAESKTTGFPNELIGNSDVNDVVMAFCNDMLSEGPGTWHRCSDGKGDTVVVLDHDGSAICSMSIKTLPGGEIVFACNTVRV